jgi:hypothetical protein
VIWEFDKTLVVFEQYDASSAPTNPPNSEMELRGTKGTLYVRNTSWDVVPERVSSKNEGYDGGKGYGNPLDRTARRAGAAAVPAIEPKSVKGPNSADTTAHTRNFLDCIKTRGKCNADVVTGHLSTSATLIANIAHKTRSMLEWDAKAERFTNNQAANRYLGYQYRAPYKLG